MSIAYFRNIEIRCSLPVLLLIPISAAFGRLGTLGISLFSLALHEFAHTIMAERLGCRIASIEIQPFGFVAKLINNPSTPSESAAISAAGPFISLLLALAGVGLIQIFPQNASGLHHFLLFNLSIGLMNLIPVLPLDGGRLLLAFIEKHSSRSRAVRILSVLGIVFGFFLAISSTILLISNMTVSTITGIITGFFICFAAVSELKSAAISQSRIRFAVENRLRRGGSMPVNAIAMNKDISIRDALRCISGNGYNLIIALNSDCQRIGVVDEGELVSAVLRGNTTATIESLLMHSRQDRNLINGSARSMQKR